ncbi:MAG: glutamine-hydrolyzing carbamoyl-phosphate synthase small subunit [Gammaproteobacteria bacterium]|nr:glutamine-hydrolyzing carbamoyl-phosphate synthase small subunit [Gammaproteobacteria bacterium]MBT7523536.1 glutamine-hydrolyzing carbamoyl-phosphate synthase small subunit [Gammaproteobacteria bacterium]MBT7814682.1 glutamine-hydrolyzing carbamoyl-phosphate synthase small subunit [Gammaproteobacteria bacterium]
MQQAILILENEEIFYGKSVGYKADSYGEIVFNTAMTGYQEVVSDPSYKNQIITFTYPHIGNVGINNEDQESNTSYVSGLVLSEVPTKASNWRSSSDFIDYLKHNKIVCIADLDTRHIASIIRNKGAMSACIIHSEKGINKAKKELKSYSGIIGAELASKVSVKKKYPFKENIFEYKEDKSIANKKLKVIAYDFGVKKNILRILNSMGCTVEVVPAKTTAEEILDLKPDGIFLSNGPGDPEPCEFAIQAIKKLFNYNVPIFGICLGHQLISLASGAKTKKMKYGHHGANHPVIDLKTGKVMITSQNHGFVIDEDSLPKSFHVTHRSLFDNTIQGIKHKKFPIFSFQGHPEACPGPHDVNHLFKNFVNLMKKNINAKKK